MNTKSAIILPLKESFSDKDFGAVSIWVDYYLKILKKVMIIFSAENSFKL